jgi:creatinine amidohydrolase/Fe(II)-dependent formamide hydrolase-like protein
MKAAAKSKRPVERTEEPAVAPEFVVIDRLEVGAVRVEPRRVTATYTVERDGKNDSTDLVYRFEEDVFDDSLASHNLASMMAAQVALNYGLFCKRIVFRGSYDENDRRFLLRFAENTAREIYVNKLLMPNPFLVGQASGLTPQRRKHYLHSRIEFAPDDSSRPDDGAAPAPIGWAVDSSKQAVLSSGGKDSLLTFGILREMGLEVHPIFVNESGRHWYTALNAYRHLKKSHGETARVWTNSDRLFAWMLRHLPFVRQDFSRVRSDEYPIRLWTVAVFAFGALPLLRKRGIGRLLIGDEYDTTVKASYHGITHYNALYDQSRFFDDELTRYYGRKSWQVCQFSILRPMSELLIQKVLVERFPELLRHQVSCHATHLDGDLARPCGVCEKCRRIVGMLKALDADPSACGYTAEQTARCLVELAAKGVHQEAAGAGQLAQMLHKKKILSAVNGPFRPRPHPETLSLRFHPVHSPVDAIPKDIREDLYSKFLEHAGGAVIKDGRRWKPFDPTGAEAMAKPYALERPSTVQRRRKQRVTGNGHDYLLGELTWPEAEARFKQVDVALFPIGAIEQHGPHLPLDTDAYDADYLARRVAEGCTVPRPLVLPPVAYGVSYHHQEFSGTLSVSPETQARLIYEIGLSAARCGITKLVMVNGHGGNAPALHLAAQMINRDAHIFTCVDTGETSDTDVHELLDAPNDVHAGEIETSTTLAIRPHLVKMDKAPRMVPRFSSSYLDFTSKRSVGWYAYTKKISESGVMGDATKATAEKGEQIWELMTTRLVELVEDLKKLSLDEIYQRRY